MNIKIISMPKNSPEGTKPTTSIFDSNSLETLRNIVKLQHTSHRAKSDWYEMYNQEGQMIFNSRMIRN